MSIQNKEMTKLQERTYQVIREIVQSEFVGHLEIDIEQYADFLVRVKKRLATYNNTLNALKEDDEKIGWAVETLTLKQDIFKGLKNLKENLNAANFDVEFTDFFAAIDSFLNVYQPELTRRQDPERFTLSVEDRFPMRGFKAFKIVVFQVASIPNSFLNLFRKEKKTKPFWKHKVPWQNVVKVHLRDELALNLHKIYHDFYTIISDSIRLLEKLTCIMDSSLIEDLQNQEEDLDYRTWLETFVRERETPKILEYDEVIEDMLKQLEDFWATVDESIERIYAAAFSRYTEHFKKVGTVELPSRRYKGSRLQRWRRSIRRNYQTVERAWINSVHVLYDSWLYRLEIKILNYLAIKDYLRIKRLYDNRIDIYIIAELKKIKDFILSSKKRIVQFEAADEESLRKFLKSEKLNVNRSLTNDLMPKTVNFILNQDLPRLVHQIELSVNQQAKKIAERRIHIKRDFSKMPISDSFKESVFPSKLVNFEALPEFNNGIPPIRNELFFELNKIQEFIKETTQIVDFALESALAVFSEDEKEMDPQKIAGEGIERALLKFEELNSELDILHLPVSEKLRAVITQFSIALASLLTPTGLSRIRSRIATANAMKPTQLLQSYLKNIWEHSIPALGVYIATQWKDFVQWYHSIVIWLGLENSPDVIATEIADYYAESRSAVGKLPFVYQRLYTLTPATDEGIVIERPEEMAIMLRAWENWQKGTFAPVAVIGERGGGISTLIQRFVNEHCKGVKTISIEPDGLVLEEKELLTLLGEHIGKPDLSSAQELIDYLNSLERNHIIILEDLQSLFLKKVNGFKLLHLLFKVMSKTNTNVFWITSCTVWAWEYLQKTLDISDFVAYEVRIGQLKDEEVKESILKRHRISGYRVQYVASTKLENTNRFKRLDDSEQQAFLEKEYFTRLCEFSQSNLSLAIVYWLRSALEVKGNTIYIGLQEIHFSFLSSLSKQKIFNLFNIVIHGGLTPKELATIRRRSEKQAELDLLALQDDGILFSKKNRYELNLLLYRPIVRLLKSKNVIH